MRRRKRAHQDLSGRRLTVPFAAPYGESVGDTLYPHMLIEDVGHGIMPLGLRWSDREFAVELSPRSTRFEEILALALGEFDHHSLTDATCDFFRQTAQIAMQYGRATYEIVYLLDSGGEPSGFELPFVHPTTIDRDGDDYIQRLPDESTSGTREVRIPGSGLMVLETQIKRTDLTRMLVSLGEVTRVELPEFVQQEMAGKARVGYSVSEKIRFEELAVAEITKEVGWDARSDLTVKETFLQYYMMVRRLRFERFLVTMRANLLDQLNAYLHPIGQVFGESGRLELRGLPEEADIDSVEQQLQRGEIEFSALYEQFRL